MIFNEEWYSVEDMSKITKIDVQGIRRDIRLGLIKDIKQENKNTIFIEMLFQLCSKNKKN